MMMKRVLALCALGAVALLSASACSPGTAIGIIRQELQSQSTPEPEASPGPAQRGDGSAEAMIQAVIARANFEQETALASKDPSIMRDTATDRYLREMTQTNQDLADNNVTAIKLIGLEWGTITVRGNVALATTYETWSTTFADGRTVQSRDRNDYRLVQQNGAWKIDGDTHPDTNGPLPPGSRQV
ncbi:MAG TPA: hypothetical protein VFC51_04220 [Chloroflexota bacterium]|nr:hypothetical protein [Chloroflexota bacterium]